MKKIIILILVSLLSGMAVRAQMSCDSLGSSFIYGYGTGYTINFSNTSSTTYTAYSSWDFGDGTYSTEMSPAHTFPAGGAYTVALTTYWVSGTDTCTNTTTQTVHLGAGSYDCSTLGSDFSGEVTGGIVDFHSSASYTYPVHYYWDFGDGGTSTAADPAHTYTTGGTYTVTLTTETIYPDSLMSTDSCANTSTHTVTALDGGGSLTCDSLVANFSYTDTGLTISFTNLSTMAYTSTYRWDFGDGTGDGWFGAESPVHTYSMAGVYNVTLETQWLGFDTCDHSITIPVIVGSGAFDCSTLTTSASRSVSGATASFGSTSSEVFTLHYLWTFGDGSTSTEADPSHTYTTAGTYTAVLATTWTYDDGSGTIDTCTHTDTLTVPITMDCSSLTTTFSYAPDTSFGGSEGFTSLSSGGYTTYYHWDFGDGGTSTESSALHVYTASGTYTVTLTTWWVLGTDTCSGTASYAVTTGSSGGGSIAGDIAPGDSVSFAGGSSFKVWLVPYPDGSGTIYALDSQVVTGSGMAIPYAFGGMPAGSYLVKAEMLGETEGTSGYLPTYHYASSYWSGALSIWHDDGAYDAGNDISLLYGTVPAGPGFISGDVSTGAGKGTSGTVPVTGMTIYLRNTADGVLTYVTTDADGNYSFTGLGVGTYNIYPESAGFATTPSASFVISDSAPGVTGVNFTENTTDNTITPVAEKVNNASAAGTFAKIYPNPTAGLVNVECSLHTAETVHISVSDVSGRVVYRKDLKASAGKSEHAIDLQQLNDGIYLVNIICSGDGQSQKLTIVH